MANLASILKKPDEAERHLIMAAETGADVQSIISYEEYKALIDTGLKQELELAASRHKSKINLEYRLALEQLKGVDQAIRTYPGWGEALVFQTIDSVNFEKFKALVKQYGFPNLKDHGFTFSGNANSLILHASATSEQMHREVLEMLEEAQRKGYVNNSFIALVTDRYRQLVEKKKQLYGNWSFSSSLPALENASEVDNYRYSRNMTSFQAICEEYGYKPPTGYKAKPYPANHFCD